MLRFLAVALVLVAFALFAAAPLFSVDLESVAFAVGAPVTTEQDVPDFGGCGHSCRGHP